MVFIKVAYQSLFRKYSSGMFNTTSAAMAAEKACEQAGLPGRIIPVPREITADCGLGWRTAPENREKTEALFKSLSLETDGYHICLL